MLHNAMASVRKCKEQLRKKSNAVPKLSRRQIMMHLLTIVVYLPHSRNVAAGKIITCINWYSPYYVPVPLPPQGLEKERDFQLVPTSSLHTHNLRDSLPMTCPWSWGKAYHFFEFISWIPGIDTVIWRAFSLACRIPKKCSKVLGILKTSQDLKHKNWTIL